MLPKRPIAPTTHRGSLGQATNGKILHQIGHQGRIPQRQNKRRRRMENDIHHKIRHLRILGNAFWANQCTWSIPKMDELNLAIIYRHTSAKKSTLHSVSPGTPCVPDIPGAYNVNSGSGCVRWGSFRPEVKGRRPMRPDADLRGWKHWTWSFHFRTE